MVCGAVLESVGVEIVREVGIEKGVVYEVNGGWDDSLDLGWECEGECLEGFGNE